MVEKAVAEVETGDRIGESVCDVIIKQAVGLGKK
jgi:hypothetical protein